MKIATVLARKRSSFECIDGDAPLSDAVVLMHNRAIGSVGVTGPDMTGIVGMVTQHELTSAIAAHGAHALAVPVEKFMRRPATACSCDDDAESVMRVMTRERVRHVVVKSLTGKVAGIVSLGDLVAAMLDDARLEAGVLRDMARSRMLAAPA